MAACFQGRLRGINTPVGVNISLKLSKRPTLGPRCIAPRCGPGNVPVILMLQPLLASQPSAVREIWTVCAWTATVSGNLTLMGSAANLIVAHVAEAHDVAFTATSYRALGRGRLALGFEASSR